MKAKTKIRAYNSKLDVPSNAYFNSEFHISRERERNLSLQCYFCVLSPFTQGDMFPDNLSELRVICEMDLYGVKHAVRCGEGCPSD